jgi:hypothetical protein
MRPDAAFGEKAKRLSHVRVLLYSENLNLHNRIAALG